MPAAARALPDPLHGSQIRAADFPQGVCRVPTALALEFSTSAIAAFVIARQRLGDWPEETATIFTHEFEDFAVIDYPAGRRPSLIFRVDLGDWRPRASFGRRHGS